jgi:hypothetical protein
MTQTFVCKFFLIKKRHKCVLEPIKKDVQASGKASRPKESPSNMKFLPFFFFWGPFWPAWIRIRIRIQRLI